LWKPPGVSAIIDGRTPVRKTLLLAVSLLLAACATASKPTPVDHKEPRRVVGTDNDVRVDAEIFGDHLMSSITIPVKYDITNNRASMIAVADIIPETTYDEETQTVTMSIGSEVPGETLLPRLIPIHPGEKKSFSTIARVNILTAGHAPNRPVPRAMRVKLNFLDDTRPFEQLISITEKGVHDPKLADELFPKWLERNTTVYTNALPMRWTIQPDEPEPAARSRSGRRRG
jgi:hypothetical protein